MDNIFKKDGKCVRFVGDRLDVMVPERYEPHGCLAISEKVTTLGIFDMILDDTKHLGYYLPALITSEPSEIDSVTTDDGKFYKLTYYKNDVFMSNAELVKQSFLGYVIFYEFLYLGARPNFINYDRSAALFDDLKQFCGVKLPVNRMVFEMIAAHLHRDANDISLLYRLTDMKVPPQAIPLLDVSHAATSTTARIVGSYFNQAVDSSLVNASDVNSKLEDMMRL